METKYHGGHVTDTKELSVNGVRVGVISGYIASWTLDAVTVMPDQFHRGCWLNSIQNHKDRADHKNPEGRQVRFKDHHGRTVGGWPIMSVAEDEIGLKGDAHVNLDIQQGREAYSLANQGVLVDFSVGFRSLKDEVRNGVRHIFEAKLGEGSIVDEPMNQQANVTEVKSAHAARFSNLDLASEDYEWDAEAALDRLAKLTWGDANVTTAFLDADCKLLIGDVIEGKILAVPAALRSLGVQLASADEAPDTSMKQHLDRYFAKLGDESPFTEKTYFDVGAVQEWDGRKLETALAASGAFSKGAAKLVATRYAAPEIEPEGTPDADESKALANILGNLTETTKLLTIRTA